MEESKPALDLFNKGKNNGDMTFFPQETEDRDPFIRY